MRINTNVSALNAWRNLSTTDMSLSKTLERLASGYRVNRAADDAAGLAVSEKMKAQIRGITAALRNSQDAVSLLQTAESAAGEIQNMVQRMRELAVQAGSDTLNDNDRALLDKEFQELLKEVDRTPTTVTFNGRKLINGEAGDKGEITAGSGVANLTTNGLKSTITTKSFALTAITLAVAEVQKSTIADGVAGGAFAIGNALNDAVNGFGSNLDGENIVFSQNGKSITINFDATDTATAVAVKALTGSQFIDYVNGKAQTAGMDMRLKFDSGTSKFEIDANKAGTNYAVAVSESGFANSATFAFAATTGATNAAVTITDTATGASQAGNFTTAGDKITGKSGTDLQGVSFDLTSNAGATIQLTRNTLTFQVGANSGETITTSLANLTAGASGLNINTLKISDKTSADGSLSSLDNAMTTISEKRAEMGALQNRLESSISNLQNQNEQLSSAHSRIRDVDMALQMTELARSQILMQAGSAMLAQANQKTQAVLSLLRG